MAFGVLFIAAIFVSSTTGAPGGRIIGGRDALAGEFPYQLSMRYHSTHTCGAAIIGTEWAITAGHCSSSQGGMYTFRAGTVTRLFGGTTHQVIEKHVHPQYGTDDHGAPINDIALFRVTPPFNFDAYTAPIPLPSFGQATAVGSLAYVTGWGSMREGSPFLPFTLQKVQVPIISKQTCSAYYAEGGGIPANEICAGVLEGGRDACQGDSGGPLAVDGVLHGIVSWGNGCGREYYPGVYTEVSQFRPWIQQVTGI
ncbi:mite allergen Der f 3-like isoform X2 [Ischnura elegans]|uniref:mite allergen Der f 3-like isoform X2 n=1 Tax=Ischnura elegans TaxID=197161 RepID=UPI001ED8BC67|nr:mite allergen Der f 3-like isoform X2 [Ischnura elegans]